MAAKFNDAFLAAQFPDLGNFQYIATGGQKAVYSATDRTHGKVALKLFAPTADRQRVERELDAAKHIVSNRIPAIYASGLLQTPHGEVVWLIEQWIEGQSLRARLQAGAIPNNLILLIARDVLSVLAEAEKLKIVHRDIKPDNIQIAHDESSVWVVDFGIARFIERTALTGLVGPCTYGYAPPEQFRNNQAEIDARTDLFALGVTLHECVEGANPYLVGTSGDAAQICSMIETKPLPDLTRHIDTAKEFAALVQVMTRTRRSHRIGTAGEALAWINEIMRQGAA